MSRTSEFLQFLDFKSGLTNLERARKASDDFAFSQASQNVNETRKQIKRLYGFSEITFRTWLKGNEEFLRILTKQEKQDLRYMHQQYQATDKLKIYANLWT